MSLEALFKGPFVVQCTCQLRIHVELRPCDWLLSSIKYFTLMKKQTDLFDHTYWMGIDRPNREMFKLTTLCIEQSKIGLPS